MMVMGLPLSSLACRNVCSDGSKLVHIGHEPAEKYRATLLPASASALTAAPFPSSTGDGSDPMAEHVTTDRSEAPASASELAKTRGSSMLVARGARRAR